MHDRGVLLRWMIVGMGANVLWWLATAVAFALTGVHLSANLDMWAGLSAMVWTVIRYEKSRADDVASGVIAR